MYVILCMCVEECRPLLHTHSFTVSKPDNNLHLKQIFRILSALFTPFNFAKPMVYSKRPEYFTFAKGLTSSFINFTNADVVYTWENPEYKVVEDTESLVVNLCLISESGTLTFPVDISVTSTAISATGTNNYCQ